MTLSEGIKWCWDAKGKFIKITGSRDEFLLTSKALETFKAGCGVLILCSDYNSNNNCWQNLYILMS
jgi:hypothetical protein